MAASAYHYLFKLVVIGDTRAGKTELIHRFSGRPFSDHYIGTIGVDFSCSVLTMDEKAIKVIFWDTSGDVRFRAVTSNLYRGAHGFLLVYDVSNEESFQNVETEWLPMIAAQVGKDTPTLLVGAKCDVSHSRVVDFSTAKEFADRRGIPVMETSAKDTTNVEEAIVTLIARVKSQVDANKAEHMSRARSTSARPLFRWNRHS